MESLINYAGGGEMPKSTIPIRDIFRVGGGNGPVSSLVAIFLIFGGRGIGKKLKRPDIKT